MWVYEVYPNKTTDENDGTYEKRKWREDESSMKVIFLCFLGFDLGSPSTRVVVVVVVAVVSLSLGSACALGVVSSDMVVVTAGFAKVIVVGVELIIVGTVTNKEY